MLKTFQSRVVATVIVLVLILQLVSGYLHYLQIRDILVGNLRAEAQSTAAPLYTTLAQNMDSIVEASDYNTMLSSFVEVMGYREIPELLKTYTTIQSFAFVDKAGHILGGANNALIGNTVGAALLPLIQDAPVSSLNEHGRIAVFIPFRYKDLFMGGAIMQYSAQALERERDNVLKTSLGLTVLFSLIGGLAAWAVAWAITRPVQDLTRTFRKISEGNADSATLQGTRPPRFSSLELKILDQALRTMLDRLDASRQQLYALNQSLESRIAERTVALNEARIAAEQASGSKSLFLANMSHEIRTPMNGVLGMLTLLQSTELNLRQADYAQKASVAAQALLGIINDILDFSKVEAGKMSLDIAAFSLSELMRDVAVLLSMSLGDKDVEVLFKIDPQLPTMLMGDVMRLRQVLLNLASNAIKFTERGEVVIGLKRIEAPAQGEAAMPVVALEFWVQDSGIGIAPDKLDYIFEGFSQAEASTTRRFGGTGLGLAICRKLVQLMGGEIAVSSEPGKGSRFSFQVRLAPAADTAAPSLPLPSALLAAQAGGRSLRVLVVDDNALARETLVGMASSLGWQAQAVDSGEAALALLAEPGTEAFQLILMDWRMPGLDGLETTRRLRSAPQPLPVVIMVSAYGREHLMERATDQQCAPDGFLIKPVTASLLFETVMQALNENGSQAVAGRRKPLAQALRGLRILVVEDNLLNQQVAQELLTQSGAEVELAGGGLAGVDKVLAAPDRYDAVLMDVQMPDIDGLEATRRIRARPELAKLPIIAMTANVMQSDRDQCLAAGMNDHVGKPIHVEELVRTLLRHVTVPERVAAAPEPIPAVADVPALPSAAVAPAPAAPAARPPQSSPSALIDRKTALLRLGGNTQFYAVVEKSFVADAPLQLKTAREQVAQRRWGDARLSLHTLKGLSGTLGATGLYEVAALAEKSAKALQQDAGDNVAGDALVQAIADCDALIAGIVSLLTAADQSA